MAGGGLPGIVIRVAAQTKDAIDGLNKVNQALGNAANQSAKTAAQWQAIGNGLKSIAIGAAAAVGFDRVTAAIGSSINAASDLNESISKSQVVFGMSAKNIERWADTSVTSMFLTSQQAIEAAGTFGNLFEAFGIGQRQAADMSKNLVQMAADLKSFNNAGSVQEVLDAIKSGISGEMEPLRRYGISLTDARLRQEAFNQGIYDGKGVLDSSQKAMAAYALIFKDAKNAIGDAARTAGGYANTQAALTAAVGQAQIVIGKEFLNSIQQVSTALGGPDGMTNAIAGAADATAAFIAPVGEITSWFIDMGDAINGATGDLIDWGQGFGQILRTFPLTAPWMGWWDMGSQIHEANKQSEAFVDHIAAVRDGLIGLAQEKLIDPKQHLIAQIDQAAKDAKTSVDVLKGALDSLYGNNQSREQQRIELKRLRQSGPSKSGSRKVSDPKNPTTVLDQYGIPHMVAGQKETQFTTADDARLFAVQYAQKAGEYAQTFKSPARQAQVLENAQAYIARVVSPYVNRPQRFAESLIGAPSYLTNPRPYEGYYQGGTSVRIDKVVVTGDSPPEVVRKAKDWKRYKASSPAGAVSPFE